VIGDARDVLEAGAEGEVEPSTLFQ